MSNIILVGTGRWAPKQASKEPGLLAGLIGLAPGAAKSSSAWRGAGLGACDLEILVGMDAWLEMIRCLEFGPHFAQAPHLAVWTAT